MTILNLIKVDPGTVAGVTEKNKLSKRGLNDDLKIA